MKVVPAACLDLEIMPRLTLAACLLLVLLAGTGCGAESDVRQAPAAVPPDVATLLVNGQQAFRQGEHLVALALADSAARQAPDLPHAYFLRARALTEMEQLEEARTAYETLLELDPHFKGAAFNLGNLVYRQGAFRRAAHLYRTAYETHPGPRPLFHLGRAYTELGRRDSALWAYRQALTLDSTFAAVYGDLGQLYEDTGDFDQALAFSQRALALDPDNVNYRYVVGSQLFRIGRFKEAVPELEAVIAQKPGHVGAHYNLGQALLRLGREEEARHYLNESERLEKLDASILQLKSTAEVNRDKPMAWVTLGDALREAERLEEAMSAYRVALSLAPHNLALHNNVANLAHDLGDLKAAVQHYQAILQMDSTLSDVWLNLGVAYANAGREDAARHAWQNVLKNNPNDATARSYLARLNAR